MIIRLRPVPSSTLHVWLHQGARNHWIVILYNRRDRFGKPKRAKERNKPILADFMPIAALMSGFYPIAVALVGTKDTVSHFTTSWSTVAPTHLSRATML